MDAKNLGSSSPLAGQDKHMKKINFDHPSCSVSEANDLCPNPQTVIWNRSKPFTLTI